MEQIKLCLTSDCSADSGFLRKKYVLRRKIWLKSNDMLLRIPRIMIDKVSFLRYASELEPLSNSILNLSISVVSWAFWIVSKSRSEINSRTIYQDITISATPLIFHTLVMTCEDGCLTSVIRTRKWIRRKKNVIKSASETQFWYRLLMYEIGKITLKSKWEGQWIF